MNIPSEPSHGTELIKVNTVPDECLQRAGRHKERRWTTRNPPTKSPRLILSEELIKADHDHFSADVENE